MINQIHHGDCIDVMRKLDADSIDLTVTSPPYDNLRNYNGYLFDFESVANELYRITKPGGVVVWIVADATVKGSETGTSFRQALGFINAGFNLHDTMIYLKDSVPTHDPRNKRYKQAFEYMFILAKGNPGTYNEIKDKPNKHAGKTRKSTTQRQRNGTMREFREYTIGEFQARFNVWEYKIGGPSVTADKIARKHPAIFPERLAQDHILSWSNIGDIVFDPFAGSGTTAKMAMLNDRNYIGAEISDEYVEIARNRISEALQPV